MTEESEQVIADRCHDAAMPQTKRNLKINPEISPRDEMLCGNRDYYFLVGQYALHCVDTALQAAARDRSDVQTILDLPCGHGRVMRYLRAAFPHAEMTACDLLSDGVDFCATTFGASRLYSREKVEDIPLPPGSFDLVWVGSLFTHLSAELWSRWLLLFHKSLRPAGVLIFSSHGRDA